METKPESSCSPGVCAQVAEMDIDQVIATFGNIVTMRGPIKEEDMTLCEEITERLAQPEESEKLP